MLLNHEVAVIETDDARIILCLLEELSGGRSDKAKTALSKWQGGELYSKLRKFLKLSEEACFETPS
jgi:hypothetical protein